MSIDIQDNGLTPSQVNFLRDAAIQLTESNVDLAYELMKMAHFARPDGPLIKRRLDGLTRRRKEDQEKLQELLRSGEVAVIPSGFRCHTKSSLAQSINLKQASLPFDNGFFPPASIASLLACREVQLQYPDPYYETHRVCTKHEKVVLEGQRGIEFRSSTYKEINQLARERDQNNINIFLDNTFGFYTLDKRNQFVLAHYNWHHFSDEKKNGGVVDPALNIPKINDMMNKRLERMFDMCENARHVLFVIGEFQKFDFMSIDGTRHDLKDKTTIQNALIENIGTHAQAVGFKEADTASKILKFVE